MMADQALVLRLRADAQDATRSLAEFARNSVANVNSFAKAALGAKKDIETLSTAVKVLSSNMGFLAKTAGEAGLGAANYVKNNGLIQAFIDYKFVVLAAETATVAYIAVVAAAIVEAEKLRKIAASAAAAGVDSTFFQAWEKQAENFGVKAADAEKQLLRLREAVRLKADERGNIAQNSVLDMLGEAATGRGVATLAYTQFKAAGLGDDEGRMRAVVDAIREIHKEAEALSDVRLELFAQSIGDAVGLSRDMTRAIMESKTSVEALGQAGLKDGTVFTNEEVVRADNISATLKQVHQSLSNEILPVQQELARVGISMEQGWVNILSSIVAVIEKIRVALDYLQKVEGFLTKYTGISSILGSDAQKAKSQEFIKNHFSDEEIKQALFVNDDRGYMAPANAERRSIAASSGLSPIGAFPASDETGTPANVPLPPRRPSPSALAEGTSSPAKEAAEAKDAVETYLDSLQKQVAVLKAEIDTYGKSNKVKAEAVDLARAQEAAHQRGSALTEEERQKVLALADAESALKDKQEQLKRAQEDATARSKFFADTAYDAISKLLQPGAKLADIFNSITMALEQAALKAVLMGEGPLAGLFGTMGAGGAGSIGGLFGLLPKFADGGTVPGYGGSAVPVVAHAGEIILNRAQQGALAGSMGGGGVRVTVVNNNGSAVGVSEKAGASGMRELQLTVENIVADSIHKNGLVGQVVASRFGLTRAAGRSL